MDYSDRPNRWPWPPIVYGAACLAALALGSLIDTPYVGSESGDKLELVGYCLILAGLALDVWAIVTLARSKTAVMPNRAADTLVTHGPFAFSRNPIYLGNTVVMFGVGFVFHAPWFFVCAIAAALIAQKLAIEREEAHLKARFGDAWHAYRRRVRRWL